MFARGGALESFGQSHAIENVVAEHQAAGFAANKVSTNGERLRQTIRRRLHGILNVYTPLRAVAKQSLEHFLLMWRIDHEHLADSGQHQRGQWVIDHRFVVHREQLFAHGTGDRIQPGAGTAGEDDAFLCRAHNLILHDPRRSIR